MLMLMPTAVLVMIVLGGLAVDSAVVFLAERTVADAAAAAANDAAVAALRESSFYRCGALVADEAKAARVAVESYRARGADFLQAAGGPSVDVASSPSGEVRITVAAAASVELIFTPALPGTSRTRTVEATATAVALPDPALPASAAAACSS